MNQEIILILEITLCIFVKTGMYLISHFIYADAFHIRFLQILLTNWIVITLIDWKREINTDHPKLRWSTPLLIAITIVIFVVYKPNFSYTQGKDIIAEEGYTNIYELQDKSIIALRLKHTRLVPDAYLYAGEKDNVKYYILLSPINREIETERMGDGNYLDKYFEMKESPNSRGN
ncbi:MAG: hypothetical protein GX489_02950 [Firmicutes bacterium]|nr:hypothetical protein [Bacillota bacterium]